MKLCVGLGNPGPAYAKTRHNAGFWVVDELARRHGIQLTRRRFCGTWAEVEDPSGRLGLLKPQNYMNRSGEGIAECVRYLRLASDDVLVIHDDIDLAVGQLKLAIDRGAGGHRGILSTIEALGTRNFWRLRVGVGRPERGKDPVDYVLSPFPKADAAVVKALIERAADAVEVFYRAGPEQVMQQFHGGKNGTT